MRTKQEYQEALDYLKLCGLTNYCSHTEFYAQLLQELIDNYKEIK